MVNVVDAKRVMEMINKVVCVECGQEMKVKEVGVEVSEHGGDSKPYKVWSADLLECPNCEKQVIAGFADRPSLQRPDERLDEASALCVYHF